MYEMSTDWTAYSQAHSSKDADSLSDLQATEALIEGMLNSDGVVVFGTNGTILAYRVILTSTNDEKVNLPDSGGGRRRTYELMKSRIGTRLRRCAKITSATPSGMIKNACFSRVLSVIAPAPLLKLFLRTALRELFSGRKMVRRIV